MVFVGSMAASGSLVILVFPYILSHIFGGYRGVEAFTNIANTDDFIERFKSCIWIVGKKLFYNHKEIVGIIFLIASIIAIVFSLKYKILNDFIRRYIYLLMPCVIYFLLVVKIAPFREDRYFVPIYYPALVLILFSIYAAAFALSQKWNYLKYICFSILLLIPVGLYKPELIYLYSETQDNIAAAKTHSGERALYVHQNRTWHFNCMLMEYRYYDDFYFVFHEHMETLQNTYWSTIDSMILTIDKDLDQALIIQTILNMNPNLTNYEKISHYRYENSYYLY